MIDQPSINAWLDLWEELEEQGESPDEKAFLDKHCKSAPPELVDEFRRKLRRLNRMNARVEEAAASDTVTGEASGDTQSGAKPPTPKILQPGFEPVKGYVLIEKLGSGGFGQVWKATGPGGHEIALKFVRLEKRIGSMEQRALNVMRDVRHPHLLSCQSSWQLGKWLIIAMDLADGTLLDRLKEVTAQKTEVGIPKDELLGYMEEAAKGIDYLNEPRHVGVDGSLIGIQHRDIKPQNLLLQGGGVKVADFGLAKFIEHSITGHTGSMTPAYSAPESFDNKTSSQSDQYSLAVTYCHLRSGKLPFEGSPLQVIMGHQKGEPDLSMLPKLERPVVARALAKDPKDRWPNCRAFVTALKAAAAGRRVRVQRRTVADPMARPLWANPRVVAGAAAALLLIVAVSVLFSVTGRDADQAEDQLAVIPAATGLHEPTSVETLPEPPADDRASDALKEQAASDPSLAEDSTEVATAIPSQPVRAADAKENSEPAPEVPSEESFEQSPLPEPPLQFIELFNGQDLSGWKEIRAKVLPDQRQPDGKYLFRFEPTRGAWAARGGELVCVSRGENVQGLIRTNRRFSDFVLSLDFRVPPGCNSKLYLRLQDFTVGRPDERCVAIQISDDYGREGTEEPERRTGAIYRVVGPDRKLLYPNGAWNTLQVRCDGDQLRVTLNGETAADVDMDRFPELRNLPRSGYIGFACHGAPVDGPWFRDIQIAELPSH